MASFTRASEQRGDKNMLFSCSFTTPRLAPKVFHTADTVWEREKQHKNLIRRIVQSNREMNSSICCFPFLWSGRDKFWKCYLLQQNKIRSSSLLDGIVYVEAIHLAKLRLVNKVNLCSLFKPLLLAPDGPLRGSGWQEADAEFLTMWPCDWLLAAVTWLGALSTKPIPDHKEWPVFSRISSAMRIRTPLYCAGTTQSLQK